jgi:hypothetical protein
MIKKSNVRDRGGAVALFSRHRAAALSILFIVAVAISAGPMFGQVTQIDGSQVKVVTNAQTGTSYAITPADCGKLVSLSNSSNIVVTIPQAGSTGLTAGCWTDIQNTGAGTATFTSGSTLIDGGVGFSLSTNQGLRLLSGGSAYYTERGQGSGGGGGGALAIQSGGTALGPASTLNVVGGTGVICVPQITAGVMTFQCNADTAYLASKVGLQGSANPQICTSASNNGAVYSASCASTLNAYAARQTLFWYADMANTSATPTLNIDTLGAVTLVRQDGSSLAINDIKGGALYRIWYDGTNTRVVEAGLAAISAGGVTTTRGLFASRGVCGIAQTGNTFYSTDIAHFSQCNGSSWADYFEGQPVSLPSNTSFITLNGAGATITTNAVSTISAAAAISTNIVGQEIPAPSGTWTIIAWLQPEDEGLASGPSPARVLYVRDGSGKMVGLYSQSSATNGSQVQWVHVSSPTGTVTNVLTAAQTSYLIPFLRIQYDGTNFTYSGCTTYSAATATGANNYGGGNCERLSFESATAFIGTPAAVGWGLDAHSGGTATNAVTALDWQVTN